MILSYSNYVRWLFQSKIHPEQPANSLKEEEVIRLHNVIKEVWRLNTREHWQYLIEKRSWLRFLCRFWRRQLQSMQTVSSFLKLAVPSSLGKGESCSNHARWYVHWESITSYIILLNSINWFLFFFDRKPSPAYRCRKSGKFVTDSLECLWLKIYHFYEQILVTVDYESTLL